MHYQNNLSVSSADFARQYAHWRRNFTDQPLFITHHGEETHVLLTIEKFIALKSMGNSVAPAPSEPSVADLGQWIFQGLMVCDVDYVILSANHVAHDMCGRRYGAMVGRNIWEALPELDHSAAQTYIRHTVSNAEASSADLPSAFKKGAWRRLDVFPFAKGAAILMRDITGDVRDNRLADAKKAAFDAMTLHGMIGYLRVSARGHIEQINESLCAMLKQPSARLRGMDIADIVPIARRVAFRNSLESVLRGEGAIQIDTAFLANDGAPLAVEGAITELRGTYGSEGAVIVVTRTP